jgi:hypothetical protein
MKFNDDKEAIELLNASGFITHGGYIHHPFDREPTPGEQEAIQHLCREWDYGYDEPLKD